MRGSTLFSIAVSVLLAALAVYGAQTYLNQQRLAMQQALVQPALEMHTIAVAAHTLQFGTRLEESSIELIPWPANARPPGSFTTAEDLLGNGKEARYAKSSIAAGEPIQKTKITGFGERATLSTALKPGMKAVAIRVNDVLGVAGFVLPGDRVDIMLTRSRRAGGRGNDESFTDVLLQGVKVLAIDQTADDRADKPSVVKTVTLEVATDEAQKLTLAQNIGVLSLALRNIASADIEQIRPIRISDLGGGIVSREFEEEKTKAPEPVIEPAAESFIVIGVSRGVNRQEYKVGDKHAVGASTN
jgi:pilus assembly protein CpaB